jgi:hypothetical protein
VSDNCLALVMVHGADAAEHSEALAEKYGATRVITDLSDVQNGDLLLRENDTDDLVWIASNVLLLPDNRAPIVRVIALEDALS